MRRLILKMSMSLDGFVAGPNGEIDWIFASSDDAATAWIVETLAGAGLHAMGLRTFQDMAAFWPTSTEPFAAPMNDIPKVVFSRRGRIAPDAAATTAALADATRQREARGEAPASPALDSWTAAEVACGDLADDIARLKRQPGRDILAHGGASFARSLVRLGLVDEYRLVVHPVALGQGLALFGELDRPLHLALVGSTEFPSGAAARIYRPTA